MRRLRSQLLSKPFAEIALTWRCLFLLFQLHRVSCLQPEALFLFPLAFAAEPPKRRQSLLLAMGSRAEIQRAAGI